MTWSRRAVLGAGAALASGMWGVPARAAEASDRRFVFVFARGGWDTTFTFSPMFDAPDVATPERAEARQVDGLRYVDHARQPSVRPFFETYGAEVALVHGVLVRSVNHRVCERLMVTGQSGTEAPDWATILGAAVPDAHAIPTIMMNHPISAGPLQGYSAILGRASQLQELLDGSAVVRGDHAGAQLTQNTRSWLDTVAREQLTRLVDGASPADAAMLAAYADAHGRALRLREEAADVTFASVTLSDQVGTAVELLRDGVARCVGVGTYGWDAHSALTDQTLAYEDLFAALLELFGLLRSTPGRQEPTLAEETVVVVVSEMGRAPYLNSTGGKDHWPYTTVMVSGPGVQGGQAIGGYDPFLNGQLTRLSDGVIDGAGEVITPAHLGATWLTLGGIDPTEWVDVPPIGALLA